VYLMEKLWFQTLSLPSQPAVAKYGFLATGEYLTHETHSVWLFWSLVNLQSANVFHNLKVLSAPAEMICLLSDEKVTHKTSLVCPTNFLLVLPVLKSHKLKVLSHELDKAYMLSYDNWTSETKWLCPVNDLNGTPANLLELVSSYSSPSYSDNFQIMTLLSLEPEIKTLESSFSFCGLPVAIEVIKSL